jgi:IS1 family transposase
MNRLSTSNQALVLAHLVEGLSVRSVERLTGVHRDTIIRLMLSTGEMASDVLDTQMMGLDIKRLQVDEIWTYVFKKQRLVTSLDPQEFGDQYVFVALDPDTKLIPLFRVGKRTAGLAQSFMLDLRARISTQFQLTTDAFRPYRDAVDYAFGTEIDYAKIHKSYSSEDIPKGEHRYSPGCIVGIQIIPITGNPVRKHVSTSLVERQNLTIRMQMRRFTRLTNAFSKKLESLQAALAIHFFYYNFMRIHQTLRVTPAMEAKITHHIWTWEELLNQCQQEQAA